MTYYLEAEELRLSMSVIARFNSFRLDWTSLGVVLPGNLKINTPGSHYRYVLITRLLLYRYKGGLVICTVLSVQVGLVIRMYKGESCYPYS